MRRLGLVCVCVCVCVSKIYSHPRNTADGSEIRHSPVEVGSTLSHYLQGFIHPK